MAYVVALVAALLAVIFALRNKKGLPIFLAFVAAIALIIANPSILHPDFLNLQKVGTYIVGLIAIIVLLIGLLWSKGRILSVIGMVVAVWAACRLVPTLPPAFEHVSPKLAESGKILWDAIVDFVKEAAGKK